MAQFEEIALGVKPRGRKTAVVLFCVVFVVYFVLYRGPAQGYWDTYIAVPAWLIAGNQVEFFDQHGNRACTYELKHKLPDDLIKKDCFGIATKDQRLGAGVQAALAVKLFGILGYRLYYAFIPAISALFFFLFLFQLWGIRWAGIVGAVLLTLNPLVLSFHRLNPNFPSLAIVSLLFWMLTTLPVRPALLGVVVGVLGGLRNFAIIYVPLILLWMLLYPRTSSISRLRQRVAHPLYCVLVFFVGGLVAITPFLYWKHVAFGSVFTHPSQYPFFHGIRPVFPHSIFGYEFLFNGLLNYPFYDHIVRTPHFSFPVFLLIPLTLVRSFGIVLVGFGFVGFYALRRENPGLAYFSLSWLVLSYVFWAPQENWEELKMSFLFFLVPPLVLFIVAGLRHGARFLHFRQVITKVAIVGLVVAGFLKLCFYLDFPADQRWYKRFPKAATNESGLSGLPEDARVDPDFFLTKETVEEYIEHKRKMTSVCLLPCSYLRLRTNTSISWNCLIDELATRRLKVKTVWDQIYAQTEGTHR